MRKPVCLALLFVCLIGTGSLAATASSEEPTIYTVVPGDTLWGLSKRFLNDPYYWPNLWAANQSVGNPHFIYPGQRLRVYSDRIEIEEAPRPSVPAPATAPSSAAPKAPESPSRVAEELPATREFSVTGGEGFLIEREIRPAAMIVSTHQNRVMVGADDIVYADLGRVNGANVGDRFSVYKKMGAVSHPVTNEILGDRIIPLGELQLSEVEAKVSKAIITKSFQEISAGAFLLPYRERKVKVALRAADRDLTGYIVETQTGNTALAVGDAVYLDLGSAHGVQAGNLMYIVRDVKPDQRYALAKIEKLPVEVVGALVVVDTGRNTSTAIIVKSVETVYRGDRVEMKKSR
jgi:LysM repeat protein